jgi:hemin uptake protein HemP
LPAPGQSARPGAEAPAPRSAADGGRCWRSEELFGAGSEVCIQHGEAVYRLRRTAQGKLILTK